jgi:hypothetical protein
MQRFLYMGKEYNRADKSFSFVDFPAVAYTQYDNVVALYVKNYAIIADSETVTTQFRIGEPFGVLERIVFEAKEGRAYAVFDAGICVYASR